MALTIPGVKQLHFAAVQIGKAGSYAIECTDEDGVDYSFAGLTAVAKVRAKVGAPAVLLTPTVTLSTGQILIEWAGSATSSLTPQDAVWGLDLIDSGESYPLFEGRFPLVRGVV